MNLNHIGKEHEKMLHSEKIPVTLILAKGGHTFEALRLANMLKYHVQLSYIINENNLLGFKKIDASIPKSVITVSLESTKRKRSYVHFLKEIYYFILAFRESVKHLKYFKSRAVISVGSGTTFATILAAKALGKKVIFVESACRLNTRSRLGDIAYRYLADLFLVQWEEQLKIYPKAVYAGRPF